MSGRFSSIALVLAVSNGEISECSSENRQENAISTGQSVSEAGPHTRVLKYTLVWISGHSEPVHAQFSPEPPVYSCLPLHGRQQVVS
jgi:hypothetical protein